MASSVWLIACITVPLLGAALSFAAGRRHAAAVGVVFAVLTALSVAVVVVAVYALAGPGAGLIDQAVIEQAVIEHRVGGWERPLGIRLVVDGLSALLMAMCAGVGLGVSLYALHYFRPTPSARQPGAPFHDHPHRREYFWPLWLMLWTALNALLLSGDLFNLYVTLELLGLSAVALVTLAGGPALTAGMRYLLVSLLASLFYLLGVALLYSAFGALDIEIVATRLTASPVAWVAMGFMVIGLLLKTALFPLHFWLPGAHAEAPAPVSAVLSALVVKASFYTLIRLWTQVFYNLDVFPAEQLLGVLGAVAIVWGSVQAMRQRRIKLLVAYSTVAQLGYLFVIFALLSGAPAAAWTAGVYFALSHGFAKSAMFLAAGTLARGLGHDRIDMLQGVGKRYPVTLFAFGLAGVSLMGLPPSGGYIAKWLAMGLAVEDEQWLLVIIVNAGALLAAGYVFRVLQYAFSNPAHVDPPEQPLPRLLEVVPLTLAIVAILLGVAAVYPLRLLTVGAPFDPPVDPPALELADPATPLPPPDLPPPDLPPAPPQSSTTGGGAR